MDYNNVFLDRQRKYFYRRLIAVIIIGIPMELLFLKVLGLVIKFCNYAGIY